MIRKNEQATKAQTNIIVIACGLVFSHLIGIFLQCNNIGKSFWYKQFFEFQCHSLGFQIVSYCSLYNQIFFKGEQSTVMITGQVGHAL